METDPPNSRRGSPTLGFVAAGAVLAVAVGGIFYYQHSTRPDATAESQQTTPAPRPPDAKETTATANPPDAASNPNSQRNSVAVDPPTEPPPKQGSPAPAAVTENAPSAPPPQAQAQSTPAPASSVPAKSDNAAEPAGRTQDTGQSKPTSLPTNDAVYVQKSDANIRSEPSLRGKRIGKVTKGTKLNVLSRNGKWVQVESGETKGWIAGSLLGAGSP
jgi:uncharacterized protein YgiM (DUF1202 family)